ncbi:unnamed protein product [Pleuronectes platessa]|uniref:Uncharacterized protein n=1 Tax=Pleuronectes platessa TaxID=8262 RepID=A0A9N7UHS0_PLEPL|nr:unnamed protein product [Pleuronectes platessa]
MAAMCGRSTPEAEWGTSAQDVSAWPVNDETPHTDVMQTERCGGGEDSHYCAFLGERLVPHGIVPHTLNVHSVIARPCLTPVSMMSAVKVTQHHGCGAFTGL